MRKEILKAVQKGLSALAIICVAIGCQTRPGPEVVPIPFNEHELVDSWIGFNDRDATCYKLILKEAGDGVSCRPMVLSFSKENSASSILPSSTRSLPAVICFVQAGSPLVTYRNRFERPP